MTDDERRHAERVARFREALGDASESVVHMEALPGGLVRCVEVTEEGVTESVAMWVGPIEEDDDDERPDK